MDGVLRIVLVVLLVVAVLDLLVTGVVILATRQPPRRTGDEGRQRPMAPKPAGLANSLMAGTLLFTVPERRDPGSVLEALGRAGCNAVEDPDNDRMILILVPSGARLREEVRLVLARETASIRFADE